ncbi:hypothetical protein ACFCYH_08425 [Streptomyces sp. NPDC056400]|uniref:hypothetical protein n=1 Tax=Streptomyces sp. NPDC056400 TaxID=3345808 RepID=UPI0035D59BA4
MQASELSAAAVQVLTGGTSASAEQTAAARELIWGQLGRSALGASALARLHEQPGEGSASIVASVIADELRADPRFAERLHTALQPFSALPAYNSSHGITTAPPPPLLPPRPTAPAPPAALDPAEVRKVWLLGIPQFLLAYVVLTVTSRLSGAGAVLQVVVLLASAGLAAYGIWRAYLLLRQARTTPLIVATMLVVLVLIRLVLWLAGV